MAPPPHIARANGRKGGRPPGRKNAATISKEQAREVVRQRVIGALEPLLAAQIANAQGIKYLVARDGKTGKFTRVTAAMAGALKGDEVIEVWEKDPQVQAFTDLLNRALDKPAEHVEMTVTKTQNATDDELAERLAVLSNKLRIVR